MLERQFKIYGIINVIRESIHEAYNIIAMFSLLLISFTKDSIITPHHWDYLVHWEINSSKRDGLIPKSFGDSLTMFRRSIPTELHYNQIDEANPSLGN